MWKERLAMIDFRRASAIRCLFGGSFAWNLKHFYRFSPLLKGNEDP